MEHGRRNRRRDCGRTRQCNKRRRGNHRPHPQTRPAPEFLHRDHRRAGARARKALDDARARGKPAGPLAGVPSPSRICSTSTGLPTLAGSKINRDLPPAARDAALIERLEAAGAILVGALNMGEYAYDFTGENIHYGPSRNPHDLERMTGAPPAARARRWRAAWFRSRSAPIPTARSAFPRRYAASSV